MEQQNRPRICHVCSVYTGVPPCNQCGQVTTCPQCAQMGSPATRSHQAICFSITAPTGAVEDVVSRAVGGLGAVHQMVSARAWAAAEAANGAVARLDAGDCVAGVIYNDFPIEDETDAARTYVSSTLERIAPADAPYITDSRFLWQPTREARWAAAAAYKGVPTMLMSLAGVHHDAMVHARRMLAQRTAASRVNYHFLRSSGAETDAEVVERAVATVRRWFRLAVLQRRLFLLGHIWHMVEDSFSPAHTDRLVERTTDAPYGRVHGIYFFGDQTDHMHSSRESWAAVASSTDSTARHYIDVAVLALRDILLRYAAALAAAPLGAAPGSTAAPSAAAEAHAATSADDFAEFMRSQVFALAR